MCFEEAPVKLHQRGIDLLLNLQDSLDHLDRLSVPEVRELLVEAEEVLRGLLARDAPLTSPPGEEGEG